MSVIVYLIPAKELSAGLFTDQQIAELAAALTRWVDTDVGPAWGENWQGHYHVLPVTRGFTTLPTATRRTWLFWLLDKTDVPGAGGYHQLDGAGNVTAKIFAGDAVRANFQTSIIASHELVEAMVDPNLDVASLGMHGSQLVSYQCEAGDPVEVVPYPFPHNGGPVWMSDFCLPSYFHANGLPPYSHLGRAPAPFTPEQGGRQAYWDGQQWGQAGAIRTAPDGIRLGVALP